MADLNSVQVNTGRRNRGWLSLSLLSLLCASIASGAGATPPALPLVLLDTRWQAPTGQTIVVNSGSDLQAAIDGANMGDEIVLQAGATFSGNFMLRQKPGTGWITIHSSQLGSLPEGTRVSPSSAASMARIVSTNSMPVFASEVGAHGYRLAGLEISVQSGVTLSYGLLDLGATTTTLSLLPTDIIVDRSYLHGLPTCNCKRGVALNGLRQAVVDSYISEIHVQGQDAQAICGWSGAGPFKIVNNYLEGAAENVLIGGGTPNIVNLAPSDIEFRHNYVVKPLAWMTGANWTVKNLFELKNAHRVLVDSNIFENNWINAQAGFAILFQGMPADSGDWAVVSDVTFTNNIVRHSASGFVTCGECLYVTVTNPVLSRVARVYVGNNLFDDINANTYGAGLGGRAVQILGNSSDVVVNHNTFLATASAITLDGDPSPNFSFTNNITAHNDYGIIGSGYGIGLPSITQFLPNSTINGNLLVAPPAGITAANYPPGNLFPSSMTAVGFTSYNNGNGGNYQLTSSSPFRGAATDGKDPGVDTPSLLAAVQGVSNGAASNASVSCDLNRDGAINVLDVQLATNQALGYATCGSADLTGAGQCTVVDVQRIISASLGASCYLGP